MRRTPHHSRRETTGDFRSAPIKSPQFCFPHQPSIVTSSAPLFNLCSISVKHIENPQRNGVDEVPNQPHERSRKRDAWEGRGRCKTGRLQATAASRLWETGSASSPPRSVCGRCFHSARMAPTTRRPMHIRHPNSAALHLRCRHHVRSVRGRIVGPLATPSEETSEKKRDYQKRAGMGRGLWETCGRRR